MSVHQLPDGRWFVKVPDKDKKSGSRREYFGRGASAEAKAKARDNELDLKRTRPKDHDSGPTIYELSMAYLSARNFTGKSLTVTKYTLSGSILPKIGDVPASNLTHAHLEKFVSERIKTVKSSTVRREISVLQAIINHAVKRKPPMLAFNPIAGFIKPKTDAQTIYPPTKSEILSIMAHANERLRRFIIIAWFTGLRPGAVELLSLPWNAVQWETHTLHVVSAKKGGVRSRDVPIHPDFMVELKRWKESDDLTGKANGNIINIWKEGRAVKYMHWLWADAKAKAGITRRLRMYDLRHFFVTTAIENGADYKTVSDIVGSDPETLRRHYQHVSSAARQAVIERMPSLI
jgi:integrase